MELYQSGNGNTYVLEHGLWFKVQAIFCGENRIDDANDYMYTHQYASVLKVTNYAIVIADKHDEGVKLL